jgi:hypothetical protein
VLWTSTRSTREAGLRARPQAAPYICHGTDDPAKITQRDVMQISDDNAANAEDHLGNEVLGVSTGSSVTRQVDSGYS